MNGKDAWDDYFKAQRNFRWAVVGFGIAAVIFAVALVLMVLT